VQFTSNVTGRVLTKGKVIELDWSTVDTDPATLSIYLVNFVQWPPLTYSLGEDCITLDVSLLIISGYIQGKGLGQNPL
jgi:hypothetical protein